MRLSEILYKIYTGEHKLDRQRNQEAALMMAQHQERRLQLYAGADVTQDRKSPNQLNSPEDFRPAYQRIVLIRAARQMEEDMPFFDGMLGDFETYVIGNLKYRAATGNPEADKLINEFIELQSDCTRADTTNRLDLCEIAALMVRSHKRDGEAGAILVDDGEGIRIKYINGDRIGNPMIGTSIGPTNFNGIITDPDTEAPVSFEIWNRMPKLNCYVFGASIPANEFRHIYDPFRFDQYHGVTMAKGMVEIAFDMYETFDFTRLNIKYRASQLPYVSNEAGKPRGNGYRVAPTGVSGDPRPFDVTVQGVTQSFLKLGEGVMEYPNDFPNSQFSNMIQELRRECCAGAKLPYEFVFRAESGGVIQRFFVNKAEQTFKKEKRLILRRLLNPWKNRNIQKGIDTGMLDLDRFGDLTRDPMRFCGEWQMGRMVSVDYGNETKADIAQIDAGLMSENDFASENDRDLSVIRAEKKNHVRAILQDAKELAAELDMPLETVLPYLQKKFPNPSPDSGKEEEEPAAPARRGTS